MSQVQKSPEGLFIPKDPLHDFEHVEVDTSHPHAIMIRSPAHTRLWQPFSLVLTSVVRPFVHDVECWTRVVPSFVRIGSVRDGRAP